MKGIFHVGRSDEDHTVWLYWEGQAIAPLSLWMDSCEFGLIELCCRIACLCEAGPVPSCSVYCTEALKSIGKGSRFTKEKDLADNSCSIQAGLSMFTVSRVFHAHLQDNVPWAALAQTAHTTVNTLPNFLQSLCSRTHTLTVLLHLLHLLISLQLFLFCHFLLFRQNTNFLLLFFCATLWLCIFVYPT